MLKPTFSILADILYKYEVQALYTRSERIQNPCINYFNINSTGHIIRKPQRSKSAQRKVVDDQKQ